MRIRNNQLVNIGDLIQDSSNGSVIHISRTDDTYCPTYSELTGGTIIQTWSQGSTPKGDRDGIVVSSSAILGGNYASNQLVDQKDLSLRYTRFNSLSIARSGSGNISECGGSATLTYTYNYKRYNKYMNDSCVTASSESTVDSVCGELGYHTTYGSVSNCTAYSIGKNGTVSASSRSDSIYADVTFRGTNHTSNTVTITQNALSGSYSTYVSERTVTTAVTASRSSAYEFGCGGGTYSATGTRYYNTYTTYKWKDSCGTEYSDKTQERQTSTGSTQSLGSKSGTFGSVTCPTKDCSGSASLSFDYDGYSDSVSFIRTGSNSCEEPEPPHTGDTPTDPQYSFAPDYADGNGPVVDRSKKNYGLRGTDNGAEIRKARGGCSQCLPAGTEFIFVAPVVVDWDATDDSDMIRVDSIYVMDGGSKVNLKNYTSSNPLDLGQGVSIYYKDHDTDHGWYRKGHAGERSYACSTIHINFTPNYSNSWKTITITLATDDEYANEWVDSHGGEYGGNDEIRNYKVASSWEYHIWQAPQGCNISNTDETRNYPGETHSGWSHCE